HYAVALTHSAPTDYPTAKAGLYTAHLSSIQPRLFYCYVILYSASQLIATLLFLQGLPVHPIGKQGLRLIVKVHKLINGPS
ncbi:MAG: hypothetical protein UHB38_00910, partial [Anaerovibrio sp.]|uniref:hypothetical protein n=1 Tax=Anaerovibrio sp. TaxID=1872532 RepID=UPI002E771C97